MLATSAQRPSLRQRSLFAVLATGLLLSWSSEGFAYRPFDGTDAAVADPGEVEVELQPAGAQWSREQNLLIAPAVVYNYGLMENWEAVLEGQLQTPFSPSGSTGLSASGAFLKHIIRPGVLQDQTGPSIATEFGVLLPDSNGNGRFGASIAGVVSQRWDWGTVHLNIAGELTRDQRADVFSGFILEGPSKWVVRPVAEFFYEEEFGLSHTFSALIGAIWQVNDKLSFDIGFRHAITNGSNVNELRAGLTVGFMTPQFGRSDQKMIKASSAF
jgi:hypothetical protein